MLFFKFELNKANTELFINNEKYDFKSYFKPKKEGIYTIILKLKIYMKDCSFLFYGCENIIEIDLSSLDTKYVTNIQDLFCRCSNLKNIDLSSFDTKNVSNMSYMFDIEKI